MNVKVAVQEIAQVNVKPNVLLHVVNTVPRDVAVYAEALVKCSVHRPVRFHVKEVAL